MEGRPEPRRFPGYEVVRVLHDGRKAWVYQARSAADADPLDHGRERAEGTQTGGAYAVKAYKPGYNRTARRMRRRYHLRTEGEYGLLLNPQRGMSDAAYPIVRTIAWGWEFDDPAHCYFLVQEFVDGCNLKHMLGCAHPLLRAKRLAIVQAAGLALALIHERGLIHRDVCTDNILFSNDGRIKLIDVGFVVPPGIPFEEKSGTPSYMSPEQCRSKPVHPASDIYSFGVVLFEVFTGSLPFTSAHGSENDAAAARRAADLMQKHMHDKPPSPGRIARDLPQGLEPIILRCLEKAPEKRYPTMRRLLSDLSQLQEREADAGAALSAGEELTGAGM